MLFDQSLEQHTSDFEHILIRIHIYCLQLENKLHFNKDHIQKMEI